ncbi:hypothetical protein RSAG8_12579, partial [Rhizoctonia solani AG-8 WAC10335]
MEQCVQDGMETESNLCQSSPENPWPETDFTEEETFHCMPGERVSRVLHLFEFQKNGQSITLPIDKPESAYTDITAIGIVGTLIGKAGLFAQCCWFGNYDLDWFWCRVTNIKAVKLHSDIRFRGGDKCVWVSSAHCDYALLVPRPTYVDMWEAALYSHGPAARDARITVWPTQGTRPDWWNRRWKDSWPWDKVSEAMDVHMEGGQHVNAGWSRLGPHGDPRFPGEPLTHLHVMSPWVITPSGLVSTKHE